MPSYEKMYFKLFNEVTDIIERLRQIQQDTEEMYISEELADLCELKKTEK